MSSTEFSTFVKQLNKTLTPLHRSAGSRGWRIRAKLAVRAQKGRLVMGLFKQGTHEVEEKLEFAEHHARINQATRILYQRFEEFSVTGYHEASHQGLLRYVQLTYSSLTDSIQLVLVINQNEPSLSLQKAILSLTEPFWHSFWINTNIRSTNAIFGPLWQKLKGPTFLEISFLGNTFLLHPACFVQANWELFEILVQDLHAASRAGQHLLELYSGIGIIGFSLLDKSQTLTLVEINPYAKLALDAMKKNHFFLKRPWTHYNASAEQFFLETMCDFLIVDPPRKGLAPALLTQIIAQKSLNQLAYISCNYQTFCRDALVLAEHFQLQTAISYDMFPGTEHLEILTLWSRLR